MFPPKSGTSTKAFLDALADLFPPDEIRRLAVESGFVERYRKLDPRGL